MVGIFGLFEEAHKFQNVSNETVINAPSVFGNIAAGSRYHGRQRKSGGFSIDMSAPEWSAFVEKYDKKIRKSKKVINGFIYNDVMRPPTRKEFDRGVSKGVYYAKFIEYGYTKDGRFHEGLRLMSGIAPAIKRNLMAYIRANPKSVLDSKDMANAMEQAMQDAVVVLKQMTPVSEKSRNGGDHMADHWQYVVRTE